tara:strand:+ start:7106 stop:7537 length:432 start_codon:yes stop_codon:yes gene_type:complete
MSGSARIVYQTPDKFEQDGLSHVDMQNHGLRMHNANVRIDREALHLAYEPVFAPGYDLPSRFKMDIVLRQIKYAQNRLGVEQLLFVFVDDIYASVLANMFVSYPKFAPEGATVHLVHYESFRDRIHPLSDGREIITRVLFYPF